MDKIILDVSADDIAQGAATVSERCPIALALNRHFQDLFINVDITHSVVSCFSVVGNKSASVYRIYTDDVGRKRARSMYRIKLDPDIAQFIEDFDEGKRVEPKQFEVVIKQND